MLVTLLPAAAVGEYRPSSNKTYFPSSAPAFDGWEKSTIARLACMPAAATVHMFTLLTGSKSDTTYGQWAYCVTIAQM